ncbi:hypothetical protein JOF56_008727 [Kibdelosporangium banguiense]|uniref:Uncharacterized protein n=1 Tax=Kibdelosporangium banguiense TaxID=1365924 RepID=A0ABS4TVA5_9PSEU|nr:hypothetical protein [Kibdelosporangium banguiense]
MARRGAGILYQFEQPFIVDSGKCATRFGGAGEPLWP